MFTFWEFGVQQREKEGFCIEKERMLEEKRRKREREGCESVFLFLLV